MAISHRLYDAFISYSHAADGKLAPAVQRLLHHVARPWYRLRALRIFRDKTSLAATPALWPSIEKALNQSRYFILLASPEAAQSPWVDREIRWWLENRSPQNILLLLTDGEISWNGSATDFNWGETTALPRCLQSVFRDEPLYVDLRWARTEDDLSPRSTRLRAAILDIAAPLHGKPKDQLDGEDVRQLRRTRRLAVGGVVSIVGLSVLAGGAGIFAYNRLEEIRQQAIVTTAGIVGDPLVGALLLREVQDQSGQHVAADWIRTARALAKKPMPVWILRGHLGPVKEAFYSRDGRYILTVAEKIRVWSSVVPKDPIILPGTDPTAWTMSPDGRYIASGGGDGSIRVWSFEDLTQPQLLRSHGNAVSGLSFSADSKRLASGAKDGSLWVQNTDGTAEPLVLQKQGDPLLSVDMSADGSIVVTIAGRLRNKVRVWATDGNGGFFSSSLAGNGRAPFGRNRDQTGQQQRQRQSSCGKAAFTRDRSRVAVGERDRLVVRKTDGSGDAITLTGHTDTIRCVNYDSGEQRLVTGSDDGTARLWQIDTKAKPLVLTGHQAPITSAVFSPDGTLILTGSEDGTTRIWAAQAQTEPIVYTGFGSPTQAEFSANGKHVVTNFSNDSVGIFSADGEADAVVLEGMRYVLSPDAEQILTIRRNSNAELRRLSNPSEPLATLALGRDFPEVAFSPDGKQMLGFFGSFDPVAEIRQTLDPDKPVRLSEFGEKVTSLAFSPDGSRFAVGLASGVVRIWSQTDLSKPTIFTGHTDAVVGIEFNYNGGRVLTRSEDLTARLWNTDGTGEPSVFPLDRGWKAARLTDDGSNVVTYAPDGSINIWHATGSHQPIQHKGHYDRLSGLLFSHDGRSILTYSWDGTAQIWSLDHPEVITTLRGHLDRITQATFSSDDGWIATASDDQTVRIWRSDGSGEPQVMRGHTGSVTSVGFSPDGTKLVTAGNDAVRIWRLDWTGLTRFLRQSTERECLTPDQRTKYLRESARVANKAQQRCLASQARQLQ